MSQANDELAERVAVKLADNKALLERFLAQPGAVAAEIAGAPVDQATLEAIGRKLHDTFSKQKPSELEESDLDLASAAGFYWANIGSFKPTIGRQIGGGFTAAITMT